MARAWKLTVAGAGGSAHGRGSLGPSGSSEVHWVRARSGPSLGLA
jgi:hypothetical protein